MVLVKLFNVEDGDYIVEFESHVVPKVEESIFIDDIEYRVENLYHVVLTNDKGREQYSHVELEVTYIG